MPRCTPGRAWQADFARWLRPFLAALRREAQRHWAPVYLEGLLGPGERKSVAPMAARVAPGDVEQLHHFVATSPWATAPLERELARTAQRLYIYWNAKHGLWHSRSGRLCPPAS